MFNLLGLRARIFVLLGALVATTLGGAVGTLWYNARVQDIFADTLEHDVSALTVTQELATALLMQKGFVTYYFLTGKEEWIGKLGEWDESFQKRLEQARALADTSEGRDILNRLQSGYLRYGFERERVVELYRTGQRDAGETLHWSVRDQFHALYALCEQYKNFHLGRIEQSHQQYRERSGLYMVMAWSALPGAALLGLVLAWVIWRRVLAPIRSLALGLAHEGGSRLSGDEIELLSTRVKGLLDDVDLVQSELRESRESLMQSEKLALAGKLAAGVAHSIRNPLTSVKMRLFTLQRSLELDQAQKEDFEVISGEIRQIDVIVKNFLEFSRPPKLKMQNVSPSDVVDQALTLLSHRFESFGVEVVVERDSRLPEILGDPEQLKEALVNLLLNACEAMGIGGRITITEEQGVIAPHGSVCIVRVSDTGPGISESMRARVFEPFFSTKEEGSGLGLAIASRILAEHGGWLHLDTLHTAPADGPGNGVPHSHGGGTTFVLGLPTKEHGGWHRS